ncbi:hypothetical protein N9121_01340 [Pseudomonadales bacterium]|nr:hypothetical protein [Pseudomonadales bacterium]MDB4528484.1 hypothetical protein [Pseudomonadales bacterium]
MKIFIYINVVLFLTFSNMAISQEDGESSKQKEESWWSGAVEESQKILDKSSESLSSVMGNMMQAVDKEIENLKKDDSGRVDTQKKINGIRDFLDEYAELKEKDQTNSCVQGIFKSSVNCRVLIDEVLYEIEEIVFDGQIISYSEKIRNKRTEIQNLEIKKSNLNEDIVFAKDEENASMFEDSKEELAEEILEIDSYINKTNETIELLEFDLQTKMLNLGIDLSIGQIRMLTTRVDGDDLAKSIAIFDVTKQITKSLGELMEQNSFSGDATAKYYGIYVILSEILGFAQREYINKLDEIYLKRINEIKNNSFKSIAMIENEISKAQSEKSIEIYKNNIKAENFTIEVANKYRNILVAQRSKLITALRSTKEQISVGYSSYITASNSTILSTLIQDTQSSFDQILSMQIPDIIPFESSELESEFIKLSGKINSG